MKLKSFLSLFLFCFFWVCSSQSVEATTYNFSPAASITYTRAVSGSTGFGIRITNLTTGVVSYGTLGAGTGTPTASLTTTYSTPALSDPVAVEYGTYLTTASNFTPTGKWFKMVAVGSGLTSPEGTFNAEGVPEDGNGVEMDEDFNPQSVEGYTLGPAKGGTEASSSYKNGSDYEQTLEVSVRDPMGNVIKTWNETIPAGGQTGWKMKFDAPGYTLDYKVKGQVLLDGALRDYEGPTQTVTGSNPITASTGGTGTPVTEPVIEDNVGKPPKAVTTETRTVSGTAAPTNAADDQRNLELRKEIQRLGTMADNNAKTAHEDAVGIKEAVEGISGGAATDMTATNSKLDTLHSDLTGEGTLPDALDTSSIDTEAATLTGAVTTYKTKLVNLKNAVITYGSHAIPSIGSMAFAPEFTFSGHTYVFNLAPYEGYLGAFRQALVILLMVWTMWAGFQEIKSVIA